VRSHCGLDPAQINGRKPADCGHALVGLGLAFLPTWGAKNPEEMLGKVELVQCICDIIAKRKLTRTKAASLLNVDQPKISDLMRGKLSRRLLLGS
jgi:predicted XRE-type DNA-binding protein